VQRLIEDGLVRLDGEAVRKSVHVAEGARITLEVPETEHTPPAAVPSLTVLYEDDWVVAVDKPAGLPVHGAPGDKGPTVAGWFVAHYGEAATAFDAERPGIVHRLDKDTTGVLVLAKTPAAQASLSAGFEARETEKTYLAICDGVPDRERAVIEAGITRHPGDRTRMAIARHGRAARTSYTLLGHDRERSLLEVHPETGRTHQIRVHLKAIGVPVRFDRVYGKEGSGRQMLHAWRLTVPHPAGGRLTVTSPLPLDMIAEVRSMRLEQVALPYTIAVPAARES
jgi:23S rRNA pseudouridine1911/1915/1917 synthase